MKDVKVRNIGGKLTPNYVLGSLIDQVDDIESVVISVQWKDGTFSQTWSNALNSILCLHEKALSIKISDELME